VIIANSWRIRPIAGELAELTVLVRSPVVTDVADRLGLIALGLAARAAAHAGQGFAARRRDLLTAFLAAAEALAGR
jgi:hypothetical protein